jgi:dihydrofolate reductase
MISLIAAMAKNRAIGKDNKLPWNLPEDLKRFRQITSGKIIVMGRKTYDSIGKPLPKRINMVISKQMEIPEVKLCATEAPPALMVFPNLQTALDMAKNTFIAEFQIPNEIMIIGGSTIYEQTIGLCDRMYLTILDQDYEGDAFFPEFNEEDWKIVETEQRDGFKFVTYDRVKNA